MTPGGAGAIAVIGVVGPRAWDIVRGRIILRNQALPDHLIPGRLHYGVFQDDEEPIDDVIVACRSAGERQAIEISCHGGIRVVERILSCLHRDGALLADHDHGLVTHDSWQEVLRARGCHALARATTRRGAFFIMAQLDLLPAALERILAHLDADAGAAIADLERLLARSRGAWHLVEPAEIALVGPPNAGKSMLANRLAGRSGAVVTDIEGTTRDWVTLNGAFDGVPVTIIDTAGDRLTGDPLEMLAIEAGRKRIGQADVVLLVLDGSRPIERSRLEDWRARLPARRTLTLLNKKDLTPGQACPDWPTDAFSLSALTGAGLEELRTAVLSLLGVAPDLDTQPAVFDRDLFGRLCAVLDEGATDRGLLVGRLRAALEFSNLNGV